MNLNRKKPIANCLNKKDIIPPSLPHLPHWIDTWCGSGKNSSYSSLTLKKLYNCYPTKCHEAESFDSYSPKKWDRDIHTWWTGEIGMDVNHYTYGGCNDDNGYYTKQSHIQMTEQGTTKEEDGLSYHVAPLKTGLLKFPLGTQRRDHCAAKIKILFI